MVAVDDHLDAVDPGVRQVDHAHRRRDTHGAGQDGNVGVARTQYRHQACQLAFGHFSEHGGRQLFADQNGVVRVDHGLLAIMLQIGQQTTAKVTHIRRPLTQVVVVHQFETVDVIGHDLAQRALGPLTGLDDIFDFAAQRRIVEHHQVHIEQCLFFGAQLGGEFLGHRAHIVAHAFQGGLEQRNFGGDIGDGLVGHHIQIRGWQHHHGGTHGSARRTRYADELGFLDALALTAQATNRTRGFGVGNNPGQLGAHGHQEGFFTFVELTALLLLNDQDPDHAPVVDDRRAQERGIALLSGFGKVAIARVIGGVFEVQRLFTGAHKADKAFVGRHADFADRALVQALGGHQDKAVCLWIKQIDRADLAAHGLFDAQHNNPQRRLEILGGVNFLDDLAQRIEHGSGSNSVSGAR